LNWFLSLAQIVKDMIVRTIVLASFSLLIGCQSTGKENYTALDEAAIREVLSSQVNSWNEGNIDGFMEGYWKSDSLLFIGSKITYGWDSTLVRYKRSYPDKATMGQLRFDIMRVDFISTDNYLVTGRYTLFRENDSPTGIFTLLVKKINDEWVVIYDHTS
jgi:hypothetical protein